MKITYTGQTAFTPPQQKKLDAKFAKLSKLMDLSGERGAHVILTSERHLIHAEITVRYYDHPLVVQVSSSDKLQAITGACDKLEKQLVKLREKRRDAKRVVVKGAEPIAATATKKANGPAAAKPAKAAKAAPSGGPRRVYKVNDSGKQNKPMTVDEAVLELGDGQDYMVYRDAESDRVHVLVKRRDGHFDLIES